MDEPEQPEDLSRSEMRLVRGALRQDWPVPEAVRRKILRRLIDYLDRDHEEGATAADRTVLMAARTFAVFMDLSLRQARLDLAREKLEGRQDGRVSLADLVAEAERRAGEREAGRSDGVG